ncbi:hypothetical protein QTN25_005438 [Entamoeba marina]
MQEVIYPIQTLLRKEVFPRVDVPFSDEFLNDLIVILKSFITQQDPSDDYLVGDVVLFKENLNNEEFITKLVELYNINAFQILPFDVEFIFCLMREHASSLVRQLLRKAFYHHPLVFQVLEKNFHTIMCSLIKYDLCDMLQEVTELNIGDVLEKTLNDIFSNTTSHDKDLLSKVAYVLDKFDFPVIVMDYMLSCNPLLTPIVIITTSLTQYQQNNTITYISKYTKLFLRTLYNSPDNFMQDDVKQLFISLLSTKEHYRCFLLLNEIFIQIQLFIDLIDVVLDRYPPSITLYMRNTLLGHVVDQPTLPHQLIATRPSGPIIRCVVCHECFSLIRDIIRHKEKCQQPRYEGEGVKESDLFETCWEVIQHTFFNSKIVKNLFVNEHEQTQLDESVLLTEWIAQVNNTKNFTPTKSVVDWSESVLCSYHRSNLSLPCSEFNVFERSKNVDSVSEDEDDTESVDSEVQLPNETFHYGEGSYSETEEDKEGTRIEDVGREQEEPTIKNQPSMSMEEIISE